MATAFAMLLASVASMSVGAVTAQPVENGPNGGAEITSICIHRATGEVRSVESGESCTRWETQRTLPDDGPLMVCYDRATGGVRSVADAMDCTRREGSLELAGVDLLNICVHRVTGLLRYAGLEGNCTRYETGGQVLPERVPSIYVTDSEANQIMQFTLDGEFIREWGGSGSGPGQFQDLFHIAVGPDGTVYATDALNCRVQKFTYYGAFLDVWGSCGAGPGEFTSFPSGIAVDSQNNVYVGDFFGGQIRKFTADGGFMTEWGSLGMGPGQFAGLGGIAVDSADNVLAADVLNERIQLFDSDGGIIGQTSTPESPADLDVTSEDMAFVTIASDEIAKIDLTTGSAVDVWGGTGTDEGQFNNPNGIVIASNGLVYVVDRNNQRVQFFDQNGTYQGQWGGPTQFLDPLGIAASP